MKTIFAMIAFLLAGGDPAFAAAPPTPAEIVQYRESGRWNDDISRVIDRARKQVRRNLDVRRPAIVLDVDDTSLSNYRCLKRVDFDRSKVSCGQTASLPAIRQTRGLYRYARRHGVTVFFITGRSASLREDTIANLHRAGYEGRLRVSLRPDNQRADRRDGWKARTRAAIARRGYRIVANVGDQRSDLDGGHALRSFKLPNPMYVIRTA